MCLSYCVMFLYKSRWLLFLSGLPVTLMSHREFAGQNLSENAKYLIATLSLRFRIYFKMICLVIRTCAQYICNIYILQINYLFLSSKIYLCIIYLDGNIKVSIVHYVLWNIKPVRTSKLKQITISAFTKKIKKIFYKIRALYVVL